jgi:hypothetical protein
VFKIKAENVHAKEFEDFWGLSKKKKKNNPKPFCRFVLCSF